MPEPKMPGFDPVAHEKQIQVPAGTVELTLPAWAEEAEQYLLANGWEKATVDGRGNQTWLDPATPALAKAERLPTVKLPIQGGGEEQIKQWCVPAQSWPCTTEQAMLRQRLRDRAGETLETLIERREEELERLKELLESQQTATAE